MATTNSKLRLCVIMREKVRTPRRSHRHPDGTGVGDGSARCARARRSRDGPPAAPARCRPNVKDSRFDSTLLGWANHFRQQAIVDLLAPLTTVM